MRADHRSTRFGLLATVSLVLASALGVRLWFLQGMQADEYRERIANSKVKTELIPPERGRIFDSKGRVLAGNRHTRSLTIDWQVIKRQSARDMIFGRLANALGIPEVVFQQKYDPCYGLPTIPKCKRVNPYSHLVPMPLVDDVGEDQIAFILERKEDFPGVGVIENWTRVYPYGALAGNIVGYVGAITKEREAYYRARGYNPDERVGQFGIELSMEPRLHGRWGTRTVQVDALGNVIKQLSYEPPVAGEDVQLTIDLDLQQYAEQTLETQLVKRRYLPLIKGGAPHNWFDPKLGRRRYTFKTADGRLHNYPEWVQFKAPAGSVVVQDHNNGHVVAMASYPRFDPRWFISKVPSAKLQQVFPTKNKDGGKADPDKASLVHRAVQGRYNLGSTIKPFIAWSALKDGMITPGGYYRDQGTYELKSISKQECERLGAKCVFSNATNTQGKPAVYGPVNTESALAVSSDAFFYRLGDQFYVKGGPDRDLLKQYLMQFGFGSDSGIEMPYEWDGRIPDDNVKRDLVEQGVLAEGEAKILVPGDNVLVSIGQGLFAATPLQIAGAYSTLATGGVRYQTTIIKAIFAPSVPDKSPGVADVERGVKVVDHSVGTVARVLDMPRNFYGPINSGLRRVIRGPGVFFGFMHMTTGQKLFRGFPRGIDLHGKTGTAQGAANLPWNDSSAFGSYATNDDKPFTVVAYLEKSGYGSQGAAPVAKCMWLAVFGLVATEPVRISDALNLDATTAAPVSRLNNTACLRAGGVASRD